MQGFKEITPAELQQMQAEAKLKLIDVRSDAEVTRGMIRGALHIPLNLLPPKAGEWESSAPIAFYCQSGARSAQACTFFAGKGFGNLYHLQGGVGAWVKSGLPLERIAT